MAVWQWSKTPGTNATADPNINYAEGQSPASLNDAGRGVMSSIAQWRDDVSGTLISAGTVTAGVCTNYTLATASGYTFAGLFNGGQPAQLLCFQAHATNAAGNPCTMNVDGMGAVGFYLTSNAGGAAAIQNIPAGTLVPGGIYSISSYPGIGWVLNNPPPPPPAIPTVVQVPIGVILPWGGTYADFGNFLICDGRALNGSAGQPYTALWNALQGAYGGSQSSFNIPDLRGRTVFGIDVGTNRLGGAFFITGGQGTRGSQAGEGTHSLSYTQIPNHQHDAFIWEPGMGTSTVGHTHTISQSATTSGQILTSIPAGGAFAPIGGNTIAGTTLSNSVSPSGARNWDGTTLDVTSFMHNYGTGGQAALSLLPPTQLVNWIIRAT